MIKGCLNLGPDAHFLQGNNVMDVIDGPALIKCSDEAIASGIYAVTQDPARRLETNPYGGAWACQMGDYLDLYFHDERNWSKFKARRDLPLTHHQIKNGPPYQPERIPQYHEIAIKDVFGIGAQYCEGANFAAIASIVYDGTACILRMKNPGHYICAVCYDDEKLLLGFRDTAPVRWLQHTIDSNKIKWMTATDFRGMIHSDYTKIWRT